MIYKIVIVSVVLSSVLAVKNEHRHSTPSQSIALHRVFGNNQIRDQKYKNQEINHHVLTYNYDNNAHHESGYKPVSYHTDTPMDQHLTPLVYHAIPVIHHEVSLAHHAIPFIHNALPLVHHIPVHQIIAKVIDDSRNHVDRVEEHHHGNPKYEFVYKVHEADDYKPQHEFRDGNNVVKGVYSLHEADGSVHIVEYIASKHSGFIANKHSLPHAQIAPQRHE